MTTDKQLSDLFADGTAPERDPAFVLQVATGIGRVRFRMRCVALARKVIVPLMVSVVLFIASRLIEPVLAQLIEGLPQFMGVPVPVVLLGSVVAALTLRGRFHTVLLRHLALLPR